MNNCVIPNHIPTHKWANKGTQLSIRFFETLYPLLGPKNFDDCGVPLAEKRQLELFDEMIIASLRHYVANHQEDWQFFHSC